MGVVGGDGAFAEVVSHSQEIRFLPAMRCAHLPLKEHTLHFKATREGNAPPSGLVITIRRGGAAILPAFTPENSSVEANCRQHPSTYIWAAHRTELL